MDPTSSYLNIVTNCSIIFGNLSLIPKLNKEITRIERAKNEALCGSFRAPEIGMTSSELEIFPEKMKILAKPLGNSQELSNTQLNNLLLNILQSIFDFIEETHQFQIDRANGLMERYRIKEKLKTLNTTIEEMFSPVLNGTLLNDQQRLTIQKLASKAKIALEYECDLEIKKSSKNNPGFGIWLSQACQQISQQISAILTDYSPRWEEEKFKEALKALRNIKDVSMDQNEIEGADKESNMIEEDFVYIPDEEEEQLNLEFDRLSKLLEESKSTTYYSLFNSFIGQLRLILKLEVFQKRVDLRDPRAITVLSLCQGVFCCTELDYLASEVLHEVMRSGLKMVKESKSFTKILDEVENCYGKCFGNMSELPKSVSQIDKSVSEMQRMENPDLYSLSPGIQAALIDKANVNLKENRRRTLTNSARY